MTEPVRVAIITLGGSLPFTTGEVSPDAKGTGTGPPIEKQKRTKKTFCALR